MPTPPVETRWKPGQSGNPDGLSKEIAEVRKLIREAGPIAAAKIIELMNSVDDRVAIVAVKEVLDRAFPKPKPTEEADPNKLPAVIRSPGPLLTTKEWAASVSQKMGK